MMGGGYGFGGLGMILIWVVIIAAVVLLVRALMGGQWGGGQTSQTGGSSRSSARQVLDERFARGEIERDEYEEKRRLLQ
jgi:putative membrane protein